MTDVRHTQGDGMAVSLGRRFTTVAGVVLAAIALLAPASPASAQVPEGTQAAVYVGGPVANCPPGTNSGFAPVGSTTINGVTVSGAGRCSSLAADAEGFYSVGGSSPLNFTAECANVGGVVQHHGGVTVPAGTVVNGVLITQPTTITTENAQAVFPGGRQATLNQVISTPTSLTRNAIVFAGGPTVGQVICGAAAYPLAVNAGGPAAAASELVGQVSDSSGLSTTTIVAGAAVALALMAQIAVAARLRRRSATT